ncbi:hypothetical protein HMH01_11880 [Halovulum dunhuangense]|uniref:Uncharacterized protein n=1 Tax=Halovulum dunhuangense TaxID=1505036 RepID=A0A849L4K8_9RHOB|nr:hypothetical protein [Halovulum dunhuangense]NNU81134.1 hypothetical protein [Halovulum dunhuangense]
MPHLTKIATCSYCGTRAVLNLRGRVRHELACASCGARLHEMKPLRSERPEGVRPSPPRPAPRHPDPWQDQPRPRKRRGFGRRLREGLEDIFDEIEDLFD